MMEDTPGQYQARMQKHAEKIFAAASIVDLWTGPTHSQPLTAALMSGQFTSEGMSNPSCCGLPWSFASPEYRFELAFE
jgi:hypothetical protein